ncbi:hypothetical protein [Microbacterium gorillae]|uniref:hypothetical protein n=1 Tax=Microbacterium gorillae TaxID=1231063 RepID=UPI003D974701
MKNPSALKRAPFWILLVASAGVAAYGVQAAVSRITTMEAGLTDGSATTAQVYGGQSWVVLESILAGAGIVGVLVALAVWALGPRVVATAAPAAPATEYVQPLPEPAWGEQTGAAETVAAQPSAEAHPAQEPATESVPATESEPATASETPRTGADGEQSASTTEPSLTR